MTSRVIAAPAPLSRPVASEKAKRFAANLHRNIPNKSHYQKKEQKRWGTVAFMIAIHVLTIIALQPRFWSWQAFASTLILYWLTACLGVTLGYHRLLSHRSFAVPKWLERFFATCGALSCQHGPIDWVGLHRHHHTFSDTEPDHHNSHKGFWWSHMGWMFEPIPAMNAVSRLSGDLNKDFYYRWLNKNFLLLQIPLAGILFFIGNLSGINSWGMVLWGIFVRLVLVYHVTWLVNSATHCWGKVVYDCGDCSRNNAWVAALTFGEGWHNNHHAFPNSALQGLQKGQIDLTWQHIRLLRALGLATKIRLPAAY